MTSQVKTKWGCLGAIVFLASIVVVFSFLRPEQSLEQGTDAISWAKAVEKCKEKYISQRAEGMIKVANCRKRFEDDDYFYFFWESPQSIFIKKTAGGQVKYGGACQVSRKTGEIVYMIMDKKVLVKRDQD